MSGGRCRESCETAKASVEDATQKQSVCPSEAACGFAHRGLACVQHGTIPCSTCSRSRPSCGAHRCRSDHFRLWQVISLVFSLCAIGCHGCVRGTRDHSAAQAAGSEKVQDTVLPATLLKPPSGAAMDRFLARPRGPSPPPEVDADLARLALQGRL
jgi:hypothetical protein